MRATLIRALVLLVLSLPVAGTANAVGHGLIARLDGHSRSSGIDEGGFNPGSDLMVVGMVREFAEDFPEQVGIPGVEYTFAVTGLVSDQGTNPSGGTDFSHGTIVLFRDDTPDASSADLATFQDGVTVLSADFSVMLFYDLRESPAFTYGYFRFDGGTAFDRVMVEGAGSVGTIDGPVEFGEESLSAELGALGYVGTATWNLYSLDATAVDPSSWSRIKALLAR